MSGLCANTGAVLRLPRRLGFFAGAERGSRVSQTDLNFLCERMRTAKHAPYSPFNLLERRHSLAEIVKRGGRVQVERTRVISPQIEQELITFA